MSTRQGEDRESARLLQPLPILERAFESISMDFIVGFLKVDGMQFVLVIVDKFSKYVVFVATPNACPTNIATRLFHKHYVKYFGVPKDIMSD